MIGISDIVDISKIVGGVLDRVWPKKMTEEEKASATKEFQAILLAEKSKEIDDVVSARALAAKEAENAPYLVRLVRGLFRPMAGYLAMSLWGGSVVLRIYVSLAAWSRSGFDLEKTPDLAALLTSWDFGVIMLVLGFFFGTRSFEKNKGVQNRG
jgi:hypothetical protein